MTNAIDSFDLGNPLNISPAGRLLDHKMRQKEPEAPKLEQVSQTEKQEASAQAAERTKKKAAAAYGRSDTILTSPDGVTGDAPGQRKTLLGA